jgi:N utilization substance protein B
MLNRRILRVKALQSLYSYYIAKKSLRTVIAQRLMDKYELDPAVHDFSDKPFFAKRQKLLSELFEQILDKSEEVTDDLAEEEIADVREFVEKYKSEINSEHVRIRKFMLNELDDIYENYLKMLLLPIEFQFIEKQEQEKRERTISKTPPKDWNYNLVRNSVINALASFQPLQNKAIDKKISWKEEYDEVRLWYRDILKKDETYRQYQAKKEPTQEDHLSILVHLFKKNLFKNETLNNYYTGQDLYWEENKISLKSMVTKTIKSFEPELDDPFELLSLSRNEEDDFAFFKDLFDETIKREEQLEEIISKKTKNWDFTRVAETDKIILKMAITEMIIFPSIPVKVTINEFIEISKNYSTPKSKQFINGILDVLANELTSEGVIKKSGRGLIDNK